MFLVLKTETFFKKSFHHTGFHTKFSFHKLSTNSWKDILKTFWHFLCILLYILEKFKYQQLYKSFLIISIKTSHFMFFLTLVAVIKILV